MTLQGAAGLHARLAATRTAPRTYGRVWANETARLTRQRVAVDTRATQRSITVQRASDTGATVAAGGAARFLERGVRPHKITAGGKGVLRYSAGGKPLFSKRVRHPGMRKRPFMAVSAREAYKAKSPGKVVIDAWNKAA